MSDKNYIVLNEERPKESKAIKAWVKGVPVEEEAKKQLSNIASMPFIYRWVAAMPDVHLGKGATVGSVIPTLGAIIPAAVGVDIGCGMMAVATSLTAKDLPESLNQIRSNIERAVPHGRSANGGRRDVGAWHNLPEGVIDTWRVLEPGYKSLCERHPSLGQGNDANHLGTLGTGNHFIEVCLDQDDRVWFMLHSGSRGVGNRIGTYFITLAREDMKTHIANLPDRDLAYFKEGTKHFQDYLEAVTWAQNFAMFNRQLMMNAVIRAVMHSKGIPEFSLTEMAVNCHHNYVTTEEHYGSEVFVTRKGAVRAGAGELGIIPGSMGTRSYIVRGKGNPESFHSCSHGAGRKMSRTQAKKVFSIEDHKEATKGIECRKDADVIDETPGAYKDIDAVMEAQKDLVEVVYTLRQVVCVKG